MWSVQIYDADYRWPLDTSEVHRAIAYGSRAPGAMRSTFNHLRIFVRPDVTTASGPLPVVGPDYTIPDGKNYATPVIDGKLNDQVWKFAPSLEDQVR